MKKKTRIICTIGPASATETVLRKMMLAGMHVARLNFSHGTNAEKLKRIETIRKLNRKYDRRVLIMGDLEGPRIRIGLLKGGGPVELKKGRTLLLTQRDAKGTDRLVSFDYKGPLNQIGKGQNVYIDDGNIALVVTGHATRTLKTRVIVGGALKEQKGVNIPGVKLKFGRISQRDVKNIKFSSENNLDFVAQSFVRSAKDILEVRKRLKEFGGRCGIVAKIENREGIRNIDQIIRVSDGIMVARGDMGVSVPIYEIPIIQKGIIKRCLRARKPVITATQMLESMTENRRPTRAEVADVANAIIDGSDYVMLSAESASGKYPVEAVDMMHKIIKFTEDFRAGKAKI